MRLSLDAGFQDRASIPHRCRHKGRYGRGRSVAAALAHGLGEQGRSPCLPLTECCRITRFKGVSMGIRGELFSTRFSCEGRTYFFNVKENRNGDIFLSVVESKPTETETFDRRSIVVFQENLEGFMRAMRTAAGYMEKASSRQKHETAPRQPPLRARPQSSHRRLL